MDETAKPTGAREALIARSPSGLPVDARRQLISAISTEIIPALKAQNSDGLSTVSPQRGLAMKWRDRALTNKERTQFFDIVRSEMGTSQEAEAFCEVLLGDGVSLEAIYLDLFAGAARRLGVLWEDDEGGFEDVTLGLCRIHEAMRNLSFRYQVHGNASGPAGSVLLSTIAQDQHVLGICILAQYFRDAGWRTVNEPGARMESLGRVLGASHFDLVCLAATNDCSDEVAARDVARLRNASQNKGLRILVGGPQFDARPERAHAVGADGFASDPKTALSMAEDLLSSPVMAR